MSSKTMKITLKRIVWGTAVALLLGYSAIASQQGQQKKVGDASALGSSVSGTQELVGYKQWTRVNQEPAIIPSRLAIQCSLPTREQLAQEDGNPHRDKFVVVYVNEVGKKAMLLEKFPRFPLGTVIVKEKLASRNSTTPELLTAMIKRKKGFNSGNGDWEYLVSNATGTVVQARGRLEACLGCHRNEQRTDFVYRNYLSATAKTKLQ